MTSSTITGALCVVFIAISSYSRAAEIGICTAEARLTAPVFEKELYSSNGESLTILVSQDRLPQASCESSEIELSTSRLLWADGMSRIASETTPSSISLQGTFTEQDTSVSEIIFAQTLESLDTPGLLGNNILNEMEPVRFGPPERSAWLSSNSLNCNPGDTIAGVQLRSPRPWPDDLPLKLRISSSGEGVFGLALADNTRIESESPLQIGTLELSSVITTSHEFSLPGNADPWTAITLVCNEQAAHIEIEGIYILPNIEARYRERSAWIWSPHDWQNRKEDIWALQRAEDLSILYVTVPVDDEGRIVDSTQLEQFISEATERDMQIWAVIGDPRDVLRPNLAALQNRISAYENYNSNSAVVSQLTGVQLDIEPYLLPGFALGADHWREEYIRTVTAARSQLPETMNLDLVVPVWWGEHPAWGGKLFQALDGLRVSLTVMNYRTNPDQLRRGALPFLQWGLSSNNSVRIALESGSLANEQRRSYALGTGDGELWRFEFEQAAVLVLFDAPTSQAEGESYSFMNEREFASSNLTFGGDQNRLNSSALLLGKEWSDWPSYSGIAIHGLDEIYLTEESDAQ